jgi:hypothetical protein
MSSDSKSSSDVSASEYQGSALGLRKQQGPDEIVVDDDPDPLLDKSDEEYLIRELTIWRLVSLLRSDGGVELRLGNPTLWSTAYTALSTVNLGQRMAAHAMDFYLLQVWFLEKKPNVTCFYLDMLTVKNIMEGTPERDVFNTVFLPAAQAIKKLPVLFLCSDPQRNDSRLLILLDYAKLEVFVFGRQSRAAETNMHGEWESWSGNRYWTRIAGFFGWKIDGTRPSTIEPNWTQVGVGQFVVKTH